VLWLQHAQQQPLSQQLLQRLQTPQLPLGMTHLQIENSRLSVQYDAQSTKDSPVLLSVQATSAPR
jgi:hypothetical protein